jgi:non-specific serine/threonine protein kinase
LIYRRRQASSRRSGIKFLPRQIAATRSAASVSKSKRPARGAALNHPNICTIHEIDEAAGHLFIAMEFVEGQSLKEKRGSGFSWPFPCSC